MESMFPADTRKPSLGSPNVVTLSGSFQSGCAIMHTVKPCLSKSRDRIAGPKDDLELMYFVNGVIDEVLSSGLYDKWYKEASARAAELGL